MRCKMAKILMSIKPCYSEKIFDGTKKYEYRRRIANKEVSSIVVYSSSPKCEVIGEVEVKDVIKKSPRSLWNETKDKSGISYADFMDYFSDCEYAFAYVLGKYNKFSSPKKLINYNVKQAPQAFVYV